jgi:cytosine/uracil/thiamine/allantoin permease
VANIVRCGLIQAACEYSPETMSLAAIKKAMLAKHVKLIGQAARQKVQLLCLQELFYGPYFCAVAPVGLVVPQLRALYDYAWFVGFGIAFMAHLILARGRATS